MADRFNLDIDLHSVELFDVSQSPDESINVFKELQKARRCFVLENDLHIIYLVVPIYAAMSWPQLDWMKYLDLWASLPPDVKRVGELVGVEERFLVRAMRGGVNMQSQANVRLFKHIYDPFLIGTVSPSRAISKLSSETFCRHATSRSTIGSTRLWP